MPRHLDSYFFEKAFNSAPIGMAIVKLDGKWVRANPALCDLLGYTEEELRQRDFQSLTHPLDLQKNLSSVTALITGNIARYVDQKRYFHKSGRIIPVQLTVALVRTTSGRPDYFVTQIQDLTALRKAESERDIFFQCGNDLFAVIAEDGRVLDVNPAWERILGLTRDDLLDRQYATFIHPDDRSRTSEFANRLSRFGETVVNRWKGSNGKYHSIEWSSGGHVHGNHYVVGRHSPDRCEGCRGSAEPGQNEPAGTMN